MPDRGMNNRVEYVNPVSKFSFPQHRHLARQPEDALLYPVQPGIHHCLLKQVTSSRTPSLRRFRLSTHTSPVAPARDKSPAHRDRSGSPEYHPALKCVLRFSCLTLGEYRIVLDQPDFIKGTIIAVSVNSCIAWEIGS